ncbi:FecR family protein [Puia sp.]|uniref:FecR family protein n=1 Tax=Puia sp. TaxID=2045100 RepID=UPI002F3F37D3
MHPEEERFWTLVSLQLAGEATPEEATEMAQLLRSHPDWGLRLQLYTNLYTARAGKAPADDAHTAAQAAADAADSQQAFSRHLQRLSNHLATPALQHEYPHPYPQEQPPAHPHRRRIGKAWLAAAAAVLAVIALLWVLKPANPSTEEYNTVTTRAGSRSKVQLPDGTTVWLNADSRLTYKVNSHEREVQLTGEAYFDVAKDKAHPFRVRTPTIDILVLGTAFDVRSYTNDHNTEASLFQGSVEVTLRNNPDKKIILHPEEKITVQNNEATVSGIKTKPGSADADPPLLTLGKVHRQQKDSSIIETLWTKNQLYFDDRTLEEVGFQLERWFGVRVTITDESLKRRRFSADFKEESLTEVMEALQLTGNLHYTIREKEVLITP